MSISKKKTQFDEKLIKEWTRDVWGSITTNPTMYESTGKILVTDAHRAQQTDRVKRLLQSKKIKLVNVSPGCTCRVQPPDIVINQSFKNAVKEQFARHLNENLDDYVDGKFTVSDRRVLTNK